MDASRSTNHRTINRYIQYYSTKRTNIATNAKFRNRQFQNQRGTKSKVYLCLITTIINLFQSLRAGSYDHHAAIYYLLLDKLRSQLVSGENQAGGRDVQRRRPSNIAEQAMRKIGRASTSEDCRRLLQHSTTAPTSSNSKLSTSHRTCGSPPTHGIDAAKLLAATNSDDALKILQQSTTTTFSMSNEASKLMATLQSSPVPSSHSEVPPFRDYLNHMHTYSYMQNVFGQQLLENDNKESLSRFNTGYVEHLCCSVVVC